MIWEFRKRVFKTNEAMFLDTGYCVCVADRSIDLLDGEFYTNNPYETYRWMREEDPIYWDSSNEIWGISRYDDIVEIEKNKAIASQRATPRLSGKTLRKSRNLVRKKNLRFFFEDSNFVNSRKRK